MKGTRGKHWQVRRGYLVPIGPDGEMTSLGLLADMIQEREALTGEPLVVEIEPPLPEHAQRLYATLGVLVRFVDSGKTEVYGTPVREGDE